MFLLLYLRKMKTCCRLARMGWLYPGLEANTRDRNLDMGSKYCYLVIVGHAKVFLT